MDVSEFVHSFIKAMLMVEQVCWSLTEVHEDVLRGSEWMMLNEHHLHAMTPPPPTWPPPNTHQMTAHRRKLQRQEWKNSAPLHQSHDCTSFLLGLKTFWKDRWIHCCATVAEGMFAPSSAHNLFLVLKIYYVLAVFVRFYVLLAFMITIYSICITRKITPT